MGYGANTVVTKLNYRQKPKTINTFIYEGKIKVDSNYFIKMYQPLSGQPG